METFEIMYEGVKLQVAKNGKGGWYIQLPERKGNNGSVYSDRIARDRNGWKYSSTDLENPDYYYNVWLNDDFTMSWTSDIENEIKHSKERFNPKLPKGKDIINDQCRIIYEVLQKVIEHDFFGMSAEDVLALRQEWLSTSLQILGYSSTDRVKYPLNDSAGYMALGMIHHQLGGVEEEVIDGKKVIKDVGIKNIGSYVYQKVNSAGERKCGIHLDKGTDREKLKLMIQQLKANVQCNKEFIETQDGAAGKDGKLELIRGILPDYCLGMKSKIPENQWGIYSKVVSNTAKALLAINYDIVPELDRVNIPDATKLDDLDFGHLIGLIIDTDDAAIACSIDDVFVMGETERVTEVAEALVDGSDRVQNSAVGAALEFLKSQAKLTREKKERHYEKFEKLDEEYLHTGFWNQDNKRADNLDNKEGRSTDDDDDGQFGY